MDQIQGWAQVLAALGVGAILLEGSKAAWRWASGRVGRERDAVAYERKRSDEADARAKRAQEDADELDRKLDRQVALTRAVVAIATRYERRLLLLGVDTAALEQWPEELTLPRERLPVLGEGKEV